MCFASKTHLCQRPSKSGNNYEILLEVTLNVILSIWEYTCYWFVSFFKYCSFHNSKDYVDVFAVDVLLAFCVTSYNS